MDSSAFCVIDVGTGGVKCLVFDGRGTLLFKENSGIEFTFDGPAIAFDPTKVWNDVCRMIRAAVKECSKVKKKIVTVSSTSMREGNVFYDQEGDEILAVPNLDARAYKEASEIQDSLGKEIYLSSGHWPSAIFLASRLKYLRKSNEEMFHKIKKVSMINDWILYRLSGVLAAEPTNGCETALFNLKKRDWDDSLIKQFQFERSIFPEVRECGTIIGEVSASASRKTGLARSTSIVVGAADTESAVAGCGLFDSGNVAAIAGTTTPIQAVVESPLLDPERRTWTCCHVVPDRWTVESNAGATGLTFKWWANMTRTEFSKLDEEVEKEGPAPGKVKVNVGTSLMNAEHPHPLAGGIIGVSPWTRRSEITLGILETNCFSVRANLEQLEIVLGNRYTEVYFCGGASRSKLWLRMQAGILGRTLVSQNVGDATGRGAAMLSAVAAGVFPNLRKASMVFLKQRMITKPDGLLFETYEPFYQGWLDGINK